MIKTNKNKGFSLIELIAVICLLGIIVAFIVPSFVNLTLDSKISKDETKFETMCTTFKSAMVEPEVRKELEKLGGGGTLKVVFQIDKNGVIDFNKGKIIGIETKSIKNTSLWLNSYQSIDLRYTVSSKTFRNRYLVFTLTPKTSSSMAKCDYGISKTNPAAG